MLRWVGRPGFRVLVNKKGRPSRWHKTIVAPYVSDAPGFRPPRWTLTKRGIPSTTHRPSRALQDEPGGRCLLTRRRSAASGLGLRPPPPPGDGYPRLWQ